MQLTSLLPLALSLLNLASAKGINCQGSSNCAVFGGLGYSLGNILNDVQSIDRNRWYQNGEHIACETSRGGSAGLCAFLQNTGGVPGSSIPTLVQDLVQHGCKVCGSIPVFFPDGDNDINSHGELTVNWVESTGCTGLC